MTTVSSNRLLTLRGAVREHGRVRITAAEAELAQGRVAGACAELAPGARVALVVPASTALVTAAMGVLRAGRVPVLLDPANPADELAALLADADPALVVDTDDALDALHAHPAAPLAPVPLGRPMHFTSGTTGRRKGVSSGVLELAAARALWAEEAALWRFGPADTHVVVSPLYHSAPLRFAISTLLAGGTLVVPGGFSPDTFLDVCATHHPTTMFTAPTQLQRLREHGGAEADLAGFRLIAHAGAPCPEPVKRWLLAHTGPDVVWEFYGCTEGQLTACSATDWFTHPGTVGRARAGRRLAVDPDGTIWCTVPPHARFSYWGAPEKTAAAWRDDAFTVDDLGRLDADGWLYLDGRRDDLVLSGGVNVYPLEVERILAGCPGVREVMVRGVPDERWGQRVEAVVVVEPGTDASDPGALESGLRVALDTYARAHLTAAQRPRAVHLVDALPRNSTGKVIRRE